MPTVLITGANRGLGLEFTRQYLADGWHVIACLRDPGNATILEELRSDKLQIEQLDVSELAQVDALATKLAGTAIDVLINNAGIMGELPLEDNLGKQHFGTVDYDLWEQINRINTLAPVKMAEAFVDHLAASELGKLVNISSTVGSIAEMAPPAIGYCASKSALNRAMTILVEPLKQRGISVALLCPGYAKTRMDFAGYATVEVDDSIRGMRRLIAGWTLDKSGAFVRYNGETIAW